MENITAGQEHFHHFFTQTADGKFYVVIGGMNASVMEVQGLEHIRRGEVELKVTPQMLAETRAWEAGRLQRALFAQAAVQQCPPGAPVLDGRMNKDEWPAVTRIGDWASFGMQYNADRLFLGWTVEKRGAFTNGGDDFRRYFKTGAAVDVQLGTRADADPDRKGPEAGDIRILVTRAKGKPVAVLYRPIAPDSPKSDRWETSTPAGGTTAFDQIRVLDGAVIAVQEDGDRYSVEAAIPLKDLALTPAPGRVLKMDWGVLTTDDGFVTRSRAYWSNLMATGVADEPTEARLQPHLWGHVRFPAPRKEPGGSDVLQPKSNDASEDRLLEELE
ncbi:MAG: hypothetical protein FJ288_18605 [Planctomycetes bacterium]|nr:hypothetical protein [Planctomycetota bacterium]